MYNTIFNILSAAQTGIFSGYKLWACIGIAALAATLSLLLVLTKKKSIKNFIAVAGIAVVLIALVLVTNFQLTGDYYTADKGNSDTIGTVTISIRCDTLVGKETSEYIPDDGVILAATEYPICDGDTVYSVLIKAVKEHKIQLDSKGSIDGKTGQVYISGINYLYEFDFGELSGWVYHVNGVSPSVGCAEYELSSGDNIEWLYTLELGNDVK